MKYLFLLTIPLLIIILNYLLKRFSLLLSYTGEAHQKFVEKNAVPMSGGIILLLSFLFYFDDFVLNLYIYFVSVFLIGFFSDTKVISSPLKRFLLQVFLVTVFIIFQDIQITSTRFYFLDHLLEYKFFSYLFIIFCMMTLINGTNFIDGLNTLALGYYLIISIIIFKIGIISELDITNFNFICWIIILLILYIFNLFRKIFVGDGGAYLLGFIYGFLLISAYLTKQEISPFFIVLLLWYPCFENLFSIVRKYRLNKSPIVPDAKHLHQLLFFLIKKKFLIKDLLANSVSANIINLYNILIFLIGIQDIKNTQLQIILIIISVFLYIYLYLKLFFYRYKK